MKQYLICVSVKSVLLTERNQISAYLNYLHGAEKRNKRKRPFEPCYFQT